MSKLNPTQIERSGVYGHEVIPYKVKKIRLPIAPCYEFYAYKDDEKEWYIIEKTTGHSVGRGPTYNYAKLDAIEKIGSAGLPKVKKLIKKFIKLRGICNENT